MPQRSVRLIQLGPLIAILLVAFGLRVYHLSTQSLWYDEMVTANSIRLNLVDPAWSEGRSFFHVLLTVPFGLLIPNEFGYRWLSVVAGVLTVATAFQVGRSIAGRVSGLACALALTVIPFFIYYSQEARGYAFVSLFSLLTLWMALRCDRPSRWMAWAYPVCAGVLLLLHLYAAPWLLLQIGLVAARRYRLKQGLSWRTIAAALTSSAAATGCVLALEFYKGAGTLSVPALSSLDPVTALRSLASNGLGILLDRTGELPRWLRIPDLVVLLLLTVAAAIQMGWRRSGRWPVLLLAAVTLTPVLVLSTVSYLLTPIWHIRYTSPMLVTFVMLFASGFAAMKPRWLGAAGLGIVITGCLVLIPAMFSDPRYQRDDWRSSVAYIAAHLEPGDQIYSCRGAASQALLYYAPELDFQRLGTPGVHHPIDKQPAPEIIPTSVLRAWLIGIGGCTFREYGHQAPGLSKPQIVSQSHNVTIRLYTRAADQ